MYEQPLRVLDDGFKELGWNDIFSCSVRCM